ncbi:YggS family pyridoxal phosphate-dependent enzyme [soil metagenome]
MAVSKGVPATRLVAAVDVGLGLLGENRVQEAAEKVPLVAGATWHMLGRLQGNKAARAVELFRAVHSVDSIDLARRLDRAAGTLGRSVPYPVYLQVNVDRDEAKAGFTPESLEDGLSSLASMTNLEFVGLMTVGRLAERPEAARPTFSRLRLVSERLRRRQVRLGEGLSMGMSDDFEVAVEEGATVVRVGRALFGARVTKDVPSKPRPIHSRPCPSSSPSSCGSSSSRSGSSSSAECS